jgi:hypothetical protein
MASSCFVAEYAITQGINHEPAFNWWVPEILRIHKHIIALVQNRKMSHHKNNMKFGIEVPTSVDHALKFNKRNGNTLWTDAIAKEMKTCTLLSNVQTLASARSLTTSGLNST